MQFVSRGDIVKKSYYAIIPANVRYDKRLTNGAKLLYGEITALCNETGRCWATNSYFAKLYEVSNTTISNWISQLEKQGYISREIKYKAGTKEVENRFLNITRGPQENLDTPSKKLGEGPQENLNTPPQENCKENNTSLNNTKEYIYTLFEYWNEKEIIRHRKINQQMKSHTNARLQEYSFDELKKAIDNYATVLKSDKYYWTHKWTLQDFMKPNNVSRFVDDADPLTNFSKDDNEKGSNRKVARF